MKNLAIFDMDGTLFDTNQLNYMSYKEALNKYNCDVSYEDYSKNNYNSRNYKDFLKELIDINLIEEVHKEKLSLYKNNLSYATPNEHLFNLIENISKTYHIALVTTASKKNTLDLLNYFNKEKLFDLIITADDVENTKPNPEGFLKAMDYFKISAKDTIIFEDSEVGVAAAKKTKAQVLIVNLPKQ